MNFDQTLRPLGDSPRPNSSSLGPSPEPTIITLQDLGPRLSETLARFCNDSSATAKGFWQCRVANYRPSDSFGPNGVASFSLQTHNDGSQVDLYITKIKPSPQIKNVFNLHYTNTTRGRLEKVLFAKQSPTVVDNDLFSSKALRRCRPEPGRYYVGDWSCLHSKPSPLLSCGSQLEDLFVDSVKPGITTSYLYYSQDAFTGSGMHIEDLAVPSVNMVRWGAPKQWLFITPEPDNVRAFESRCRETFQRQRKSAKHHYARSECSQFVRHTNALFTNEVLREWGIKFTETTCWEGELVVTLPGTYHQVVNQGENLAEAVNVMWSGCTEVPLSYACCSRNLCGHGGGISQDDLAPKGQVCGV